MERLWTASRVISELSLHPLKCLILFPKFSHISCVTQVTESGDKWQDSVATAAAAAAKSLQSCPTLCDPRDGSPQGSPIPGILQARTLEWVAISLSNAWKWKVKVKLLSRVRLLATPWTAAHQAPPSMGFSRGLKKKCLRDKCLPLVYILIVLEPQKQS